MSKRLFGPLSYNMRAMQYLKQKYHFLSGIVGLVACSLSLPNIRLSFTLVEEQNFQEIAKINAKRQTGKKLEIIGEINQNQGRQLS